MYKYRVVDIDGNVLNINRLNEIRCVKVAINWTKGMANKEVV